MGKAPLKWEGDQWTGLYDADHLGSSLTETCSTVEDLHRSLLCLASHVKPCCDTVADIDIDTAGEIQDWTWQYLQTGDNAFIMSACLDAVAGDVL